MWRHAVSERERASDMSAPRCEQIEPDCGWAWQRCICSTNGVWCALRAELCMRRGCLYMCLLRPASIPIYKQRDWKRE